MPTKIAINLAPWKKDFIKDNAWPGEFEDTGLASDILPPYALPNRSKVGVVASKSPIPTSESNSNIQPPHAAQSEWLLGSLLTALNHAVLVLLAAPAAVREINQHKSMSKIFQSFESSDPIGSAQTSTNFSSSIQKPCTDSSIPFLISTQAESEVSILSDRKNSADCSLSPTITQTNRSTPHTLEERSDVHQDNENPQSDSSFIRAMLPLTPPSPRFSSPLAVSNCTVPYETNTPSPSNHVSFFSVFEPSNSASKSLPDSPAVASEIQPITPISGAESYIRSETDLLEWMYSKAAYFFADPNSNRLFLSCILYHLIHMLLDAQPSIYLAAVKVVARMVSYPAKQQDLSQFLVWRLSSHLSHLSKISIATHIPPPAPSASARAAILQSGFFHEADDVLPQTAEEEHQQLAQLKLAIKRQQDKELSKKAEVEHKFGNVKDGPQQAEIVDKVDLLDIGFRYLYQATEQDIQKAAEFLTFQSSFRSSDSSPGERPPSTLNPELLSMQNDVFKFLMWARVDRRRIMWVLERQQVPHDWSSYRAALYRDARDQMGAVDGKPKENAGIPSLRNMFTPENSSPRSDATRKISATDGNAGSAVNSSLQSAAALKLRVYSQEAMKQKQREAKSTWERRHSKAIHAQYSASLQRLRRCTGQAFFSSFFPMVNIVDTCSANCRGLNSSSNHRLILHQRGIAHILQWYSVFDGQVRVRKAPTFEAEVTGSLKFGDVIEELEREVIFFHFSMLFSLVNVTFD